MARKNVRVKKAHPNAPVTSETETLTGQEATAEQQAVLAVAPSGVAQTTFEYQTLEIYNPRPSLTTANRCYKAYPGLEYNIRMAVAGGHYPYTYSLDTAPAGMTINASTGEITWPSPPEAGSPHSVTATVTDYMNQTASVTWTVTVTTSGFYFLDAVNGNSIESGATGAIGDPFKTIGDITGKTVRGTTTFPGGFVYWRTGNYGIDAITEDAISGVDGGRVPWGDNKPLVHLAYPGESPVLWNKLDGFTDGYIWFYGGTLDDFWWDGIDINDNSASRGIALAVSPDSRFVIRRSHFYGVTSTQGGGNNSALFLTGGLSEYNAIQDCEFTSPTNVGYGVLGYDCPKTLIEGNSATNVGFGFSPKSYNDRWTIRGNTMVFDNAGTRALGTQCYYSASRPKPGNIEICFNYIKAPNADWACQLNTEWLSNSGQAGPHWVYRNTIVGLCEVMGATSDATCGPFEWKNNVILTDNSPAVKVAGVTDLSKVVTADNVVDVEASTIIDANGLLTGATRDTYLGVAGHEV